ncbi:hypothetical protein DPM33_14635 [Mesorhizobium hawassense]|uniref:Uncharacterized protein n=1 Tax=Mesorhizobium hawassense TaxID=1209954 RepID=A0A330HMX6_9HYPH|nr:hypothetical protein DPM33_14635 [Mesorhizobium hawassense]
MPQVQAAAAMAAKLVPTRAAGTMATAQQAAQAAVAAPASFKVFFIDAALQVSTLARAYSFK